MADALKTLPVSNHPDLLVGFNKADDAGVFRINDTTALVQTVDFFPPIVDDPYSFGQIAAANALSDVYAMGGRPVTALNIVGFPKGALDPWIFTEILRGGSDKVAEAGAVVVGGHSINDKELKYGVSVTGLIDPNRIITNAGARPGDVLFLTKRLGTGLITTGIKRGLVGTELAQTAIDEMAKLNRVASELMIAHGAHAATDITGYGLMGHTLEMAEASDSTVRLFSAALPQLPEVLPLAQAGMIPGGANANREFLDGKWRIEGAVDPNVIHLMFDPQTSGGLLIAVPESSADPLAAALRENHLPHQPIGRVETRSDVSIVVE